MLSLESSDNWLLNGRETLADWALWPFVRQYRLVDPISFDNDQDLNQLGKWLRYYLNNPKFDILMAKSIPWQPGQTKKYFPPRKKIY